MPRAEVTVSPRQRVEVEASRKRGVILDAVERVMLAKGYSGVTYRAVASEAGVTAGMVQYYFPAHEDLFVSAIQRRADQNVERLREALEAGGVQTLGIIWELSQDESVAALTAEYLALGNHSEGVRAEIAKVTEVTRQLQLEALRDAVGLDGVELGRISPEVLLFLLTGIPRLIRIESGVGISAAHDEVLDTFERYLRSEGATVESSRDN
jgi:TetR/AcrR family transcriptional regulator, transcriptional repressor for nem operon